MALVFRSKVHSVWILVLVCLITVLVGKLVVGAAPPYGRTIRVSVSNDGGQNDEESLWPAISANGNKIAFQSRGSQLVPGDYNFYTEIFVRDVVSNTTTRVSVTTGGREANGTSYQASLSEDGRYVSFQSDATNLDTIPVSGMQLYWRDTVSDTTRLASHNAAGQSGNAESGRGAIADNGQVVAFESLASNLDPYDRNLARDVFVYDRATDEVARVSIASTGAEANGPSGYPSISADGRFVAFYSEASNLVPDDTNGVGDIFIRDRVTFETRLVSRGLGGALSDGPSTAPALSADGRFVVYQSNATNLVANDTNGTYDIFITELSKGVTERVSVSTGGIEANDYSDAPDINDDGTIVVYFSRATNLAGNDTNEIGDIFWHNRTTGETRRVSLSETDEQLNGISDEVAVDGKGYVMAFRSDATNAIAYDTNELKDIFLRQEPEELPPPTPTATPYPNSLYLPALTVRRSIADFPQIRLLTAGADNGSWHPRIADEGRVVAFLSDATNLAGTDTNGVGDVYVWFRDTGTFRRVSLRADGSENDKPVTWFALSDNGEWVAFATDGALVGADTNGMSDVYRANITTGVVTLVSATAQGTAGDSASFAPDISANGRWIVFQTAARNLSAIPIPETCVGGPCETVLRRDMDTGEIIPVALDDAGYAATPLRSPSISDNGQRVAFEWIQHAGDTGGDGPRYYPFIYRAAVDSGELTLLGNPSVYEPICPTPSGGGGRCSLREYTIARIAPEGDNVAWFSHTYALSQYGGDEGWGLGWRGDGGFGNAYSFYHPLTLQLVSGHPAAPTRAEMSEGAVVTAFEVTDLLPGESNEEVRPEMEDDSNSFMDVYVVVDDEQLWGRVSRDDTGGGWSNGDSTDPDVSNSGRTVVFASRATNLGPNDPNGATEDIYLWEWALAAP